MTKPPDLTTAEFFALPIAERRAHSAEQDAYRASPEGLAEARAHQERQQASFEAMRIKLAEQIFRGTDNWRSRGERLDLPKRAVDVVLSGQVESTPAMQAVRGCTDILVLSGGVGTGKTVAAAERVREYVYASENWHPLSEYSSDPSFRVRLPVWISAAELARVDHFSTVAVDRFTKRAPVLVIDDLFSEYLDTKGFLAALLDEIIDARYAGKLATVITTNCNAAGFAERYGERIVDRIREGGRFFTCGISSMRKAGQE